MQNIDFLEHGGQRRIHVLDGEEYAALVDPREMDFQDVLRHLRVEHAPGTPNCPEWQRALLFDRWRAAYDLPRFEDAQRLAYLVDHYRGAINYDLFTYSHADLGDLWRARRWQTLLDLVDHLPAHSWYSATVASDEEHARMLAESMAARGDSGEGEDPGPPLTTWTPEVRVMTDVLDAVRHVSYAVIAAQVGKKAGDPPKPSKRPVTPLERAMKRAKDERRKAKHESLVARMLPHKRNGSDTVH